MHEKKAPALTSVHHPIRNPWPLGTMDVLIRRAAEAAGDELGSYVGQKNAPRWVWHAIDHHTGKGLASVCGRRQDQMLLKRTALLEPCGIMRYDTDYWGAYTHHLDTDEHKPGKRNTQKIERTPLTLRTQITRLPRRTIGFSRSVQRHDIVIGLCVHRYACGLSM